MSFACWQASWAKELYLDRSKSRLNLAYITRLAPCSRAPYKYTVFYIITRFLPRLRERCKRGFLVYIPLFPSCQKAPLSIALLDPRQQTTGRFFFLALLKWELHLRRFAVVARHISVDPDCSFYHSRSTEICPSRREQFQGSSLRECRR